MRSIYSIKNNDRGLFSTARRSNGIFNPSISKYINFAFMKKWLFTLLVFNIATSFAQTVSISDFFEYNLFNAGVYVTAGNGYATGNNELGDLEKGMRFNAQTGLPNSNGYLTNVLAWIPFKSNNSGTGQFTVKIYEFATIDSLGALLGSQTYTLQNLDTVTDNYSYIGGPLALGGKPYNLDVAFSNPVAIPSSKDILVMIELPTAPGDNIGIMSNLNGDFPLASSHSFEVQADGTLVNLHDAWQNQLDVAMAIFPVINLTNSIEEHVINCEVFPNPTSQKLYFSTAEDIELITIYAPDGKLLGTTQSSSIDVSYLQQGAYLYALTTKSGGVSKGNFLKID
jgi:hypothetical protein